MKSPLDVAKESPYYKRNHMGKVTCTLCNIYCNDENNFIKHISGKTHTMSLERIEQMERRQRHLKEEDQRNLEAYERAQQEQRARELVLQQQSGTGVNASAAGVSSSMPALTGVHGLPQYTFKTEHDPVRFCTKIWLEFFFPHAEDGTRPAHRWMSAREQKVEVYNSNTEQDYYVYLLVACEGYTTAALKFPAGAKRTTEDEERWRKMQQQQASENPDSQINFDDDGPRYRSTWNGLRRQYSVFFELYR